MSRPLRIQYPDAWYHVRYAETTECKGCTVIDQEGVCQMNRGMLLFNCQNNNSGMTGEVRTTEEAIFNAELVYFLIQPYA